MIMEEKNDIIQSQLKAVDEMFIINYITGDNAVFEKTEEIGRASCRERV